MPDGFKPITRSSKSDEFEFVDVTNQGLIPGKALTEGRMKFLEKIIKKVQRLIQDHKDVPKKTQIEQLYESLNLNSNQASSSRQ